MIKSTLEKHTRHDDEAKGIVVSISACPVTGVHLQVELFFVALWANFREEPARIY